MPVANSPEQHALAIWVAVSTTTKTRNQVVALPIEEEHEFGDEGKLGGPTGRRRYQYRRARRTWNDESDGDVDHAREPLWWRSGRKGH